MIIICVGIARNIQCHLGKRTNFRMNVQNYPRVIISFYLRNGKLDDVQSIVESLRLPWDRIHHFEAKFMGKKIKPPKEK